MGVMGVRELILELWTRTRIDWGFASERIAEVFRRERQLGSRERREVAETLYGMIRQARRIDFALEPLRLTGDLRELSRYLAYRVLEDGLAPADAARELSVDWKAVAAVDERIARERDPVRRLALGRSLPDWLAKKLLDQYEDEADGLAASLNRRAPLTIRVNTLKTTREALAERLKGEGLETHPTKYATTGLVLDTRTNLFGIPAFKEGLFEAQDEASQLVAELVAPPPKALVIDACAGAGGKTLAIGAAMGSKGRIVGLDVDDRKLEELRRRARRAGLSNARALSVEATTWPADPDEVAALRGHAERVLVDAPCSGIGALRRNPEARWRLSEADVDRLPRQQLDIASRAKALVAPGGRLIYATCTLLRQENEAVLERLLAPGWEIMRVAEVWGTDRASTVSDATATFLTLRPDRHDTDGFFAAILRRAREK